MAVKPLRSVERALAVLEAIGAHMPIGVASLARLLDEDKSAVQRVLVTLHASGWIAPTEEDNTRWKLTTRPLVVTSQGQSRSGTLQRVRVAMEALREETDETVFMVVPEAGRIVIVDVVESRQLIRIAPHAGIVLPQESAGGKAILDPVERRWAIDEDVVADGATCVGSAVIEAGRPVAAIVVSAPSNRMGRRRQEQIGVLVARAAAEPD